MAPTRSSLFTLAVVSALLAVSSGCCTTLNGMRWMFGCVDDAFTGESGIAEKFPLDTPTSTFEAFKFTVRSNSATLCHRYVLARDVREQVPFADFSIGWDEKIQVYRQVAMEAWVDRVERVKLLSKDGKADPRPAAVLHCISRDGRTERFLVVREDSVEPSNAFWFVGAAGVSPEDAAAAAAGEDSPTGEGEDSPYPDASPAASPTETPSAEPEPSATPAVTHQRYERWRMIFPSHFQRDSTWFPEIAEMIREAEADVAPAEPEAAP